MKIGRPEMEIVIIKKKKAIIIIISLSLKSCYSLLTQCPHPELPRANGLNKNVLKKILANFITKETENPYICIQHVYYNYLLTVSKPNYW